jgi:hypothetical protein
MSDFNAVTAAEDDLKALIEPLQKQREELLTEQQRVKLYLVEVERTLRRIEQMLAAAGWEKPKPEPARRVRKHVSQERTDEVIALLEANPGETFTATEVGQRVGMAAETARHALYKARDQGRIRLAAASQGRGGAATFAAFPKEDGPAPIGTITREDAFKTEPVKVDG